MSGTLNAVTGNKRRRAHIVLCLLGGLLAGCATGSTTTRDGSRPARLERSSTAAFVDGHFRFFSPTSFWNTPVAPGATIAARSQRVVDALRGQLAAERAGSSGPTIDTTAYSVPIYVVPANQATITVTLASGTPALALRAAWRAVPMPAGAQPAAGSDGHLVLWQPSRDRLWEFWRLAHGPAGWSAQWGGAMREVSRNPGVYGPGAWPGATRFWGASASSLSIAGGLITFEDLRSGVINHALAIASPNIRAGVFTAPARRTDGTSSSPFSLREGDHLRLDPHLRLVAMHLPALTLMIARAAQRYGLYVIDSAPRVTSFYAQDPITLASNPYPGPDGYFAGRSANELALDFPWAHLQLLQQRRRGPR